MRKRIVVFITSIVALSTLLNAQNKDTLLWTVEGNAGMEFVDFYHRSSAPQWNELAAKQNDIIVPSMGVSMGVMASRKLGDNNYLGTGAMWLRKREQYNADELPEMLSMWNDYQWMSVPLMFKHLFDNNEQRKFFLEGGLSWNSIFQSKSTYRTLGMNQSQTVDVAEGLRKSALSAHLKMGWQWDLTANWYGTAFVQGNYFFQSIGSQKTWGVHPWGCGMGIGLGKRK